MTTRDKLPIRERRIYDLRKAGTTYAEIGRREHLVPRRVKQLYVQACKRLGVDP